MGKSSKILGNGRYIDKPNYNVYPGTCRNYHDYRKHYFVDKSTGIRDDRTGIRNPGFDTPRHMRKTQDMPRMQTLRIKRGK
ncbi:MAG TPA: hypothetical protein ENF20_01550 [Candidatus Marinimicrobia bacterium]|nr:hypothetical protein [Candidatus Neomarinimicrobiota bacterium]